mgnify:CR=1 FL=1
MTNTTECSPNEIYNDIVTAYSVKMDENPGFGNWHLKVAHFPVRFPETVWDISYKCGLAIITVTRCLTSVKKQLDLSVNLNQPFAGVPIEISKGELPAIDYTVIEVGLGIIHGCQNEPQDIEDVEHYKLSFIEGPDRYDATIYDPYSRDDTEEWQRLVNRIIGSGLSVPRRFAAA